MSDQKSCDDFSRSLLAETAPAEVHLYETYAAALEADPKTGKVGVGLGIPAEMMGLISIAAVMAGHLVYDLLLDWGKNIAGEIVRKYVVDTGVAKLKTWLGAPKEAGLKDVLTAEGQIAILAVVEREAKTAGLSEPDTRKLKKAVLDRLGIV